MKKSTRLSFIFAIALGTFALIGGTGLTVSSAWLITMASAHPPILILGVSIVLVRFFGIFRSVARYGERVISHEAIFRKLTGLRVQLFGAFATRLNGGDHSISQQSKAVIDDVERAQEFHLRVTLPGISAALAGSVTVLLSAWIAPFLALYLLPPFCIFAILMPWAVKKFLDPIAVEIEERENLFSEEIAASSHAMVEAQIFGYRDYYQNSLTAGISRLRDLERRSFAISSALAFIVLATIGGTLTAGSVALMKQDEILPITVSMSIFIILIGFEGYTSWFPSLFPAGKNRRAKESISVLAERTIESTSSRKMPEGSALVARDCEAHWSDKFLKPFSFEVHPGEILVVEGPSGVGKSTLAAALLGFAPYSGSIAIGGVEVRDIEDRYRFISGSLQSSHIFNTTLRENLKIANERATDEKLLEILTRLELHYIPLDEVLGEFGRALSGGEAKRLAVARALLSESPIVILDEPLEHLDHELALRIQLAIGELAAGRSLIVITHSPWLQYSRKLTLARE